MSITNDLETIRWRLGRLMREHGGSGDGLAELASAFDGLAEEINDMAERLDRLEAEVFGSTS